MQTKITIEIQGVLNENSVSELKEYILDFCKENKANSYLFEMRDDFN